VAAETSGNLAQGLRVRLVRVRCVARVVCFK